MVDLWYLVIFMAGLVYSVRVYFRSRRFWHLIGKFKGEDPLPIIGNAHQMGTNPEDILTNFYNTFRKVGYESFRLIIGFDVFIMLCEPDHVEALLCDQNEITKLDDYSFLASWLGDGLLLATGNKWRKQRKFINPAFHVNLLAQFVEIFNTKTNTLMDKLNQNKERVFDVFPIVSLYALDIISETTMGVCINAQEDSDSKYIKGVYRMCAITTRRTFSPIWRNDFFYNFSSMRREEQRILKVLHATTNKVIQERRSQLKDETKEIMKMDQSLVTGDGFELGQKKRMTFLDILLLNKNADGKLMTDEEIRQEVDTFMFAGHDTTASSLGFAIYCLANNPNIQAKAFEEQLSIFGDNMESPVIYKDLQNMKYLEMVIKETLRLYPSVPFFGRRLVNDLKLQDGRVLPGGCFASVMHFCMHRSSKYFPEPDKFDPERFTLENLKGKHPYLYVPFSAGPRNCIGQKFAMLEIKTALSKILRRFELYSAGPGLEPKLSADITLKAVNGINIQLRDRTIRN